MSQYAHRVIIKSTDVLSEPFKAECERLIEELSKDPKTMILKVFETLRLIARQDYLYKNSRSRTMNSKHLCGWACDFVPHTDKGWSWADRDITGDGTLKDEREAYYRMREIVKEKFPKLKYLSEWDLSHVELA